MPSLVKQDRIQAVGKAALFGPRPKCPYAAPKRLGDGGMGMPRRRRHVGRILHEVLIDATVLVQLSESLSEPEANPAPCLLVQTGRVHAVQAVDHADRASFGQER